MRWSITLAKIAGIKVRMHLTFLLLLAWIGFMYYQSGGWTAAIAGIEFILLIFGCVILHEFGHAIAARFYGIKTPDITLLPIGGVARMEKMPDKPSQELVVALAGPAVNVVIAGVLFAFQPWPGGFDLNALISTMAQFDDIRVNTWLKLGVFNVIMVLFNMIPAFPMDGGRVLRSLLAMVMPYGVATNIAATIGQMLAFGFGLLGLFGGNPLLILIAFFVYFGAAQEARMAQLKELSTGLTIKEAMMTGLVTLGREHHLDAAVDALLRTSQHEFPILDEEGRVLGVLTRNGMIDSLRHHGPDHPVTEAMTRDLPSVPYWMSFDEAFRKMQECKCPALPVVDASGHFMGLVTPENVGEMMMIQSVLPKNTKPSWRE